MAIINNTQLTVVLDKLARFATEAVGDPEFNAAFTAGMETASNDVFSGSGALSAYLITTADEDILADMLPPARILDETHPVHPDGFLLNIASVNNQIKGIDAHFKHFGYKGLDDYLSTQNAITPTLRAHGHFKKYLKTLSAINSFIPNDLVLATFAITGAAAGTYSHAAAIDKTSYAGAKLVLKNNGVLATGPVVTVAAKRFDGTAVNLTATISTLTDAAETNLSDTAKLYVDVTNVTIASGGTNANAIKVVAKTDRSIASA